VLFGCVFLSLVAHIATFFIFQVVYPQRVTIPPPAPQVALLTGSSPENESLLRWIAAEDPALVASAHSVAPPNILAVPYRPSFATVRTNPRGSVEAQEPMPFPPARSPLAIIRSAAPRSTPVSSAGTSAPTHVAFSSALEGRALIKPAEFTWKSKAVQPLSPFRALVGVTGPGEVRFTFLQHPSGNDSADAEALAQLGRLSFAPAEAPITWALATITFGADAYGENPPPPEVGKEPRHGRRTGGPVPNLPAP
jgi:hypothetical protein